MRHIIDSLIVGAVVAVMALPMGTPAGGSGKRQGKQDSAVNIGVGIQIDSDWISLKTSWSIVPASEASDTEGNLYELRIGVLPNFVGRADKGVAIARALHTTAVCAAKVWLKDHYNNKSP